MRYFNRVRVATATTGTGTLTYGAAVTDGFLTPEEAGCVTGDRPVFIIEEGNDFEMVWGAIDVDANTITRAEVITSKIGGVQGTSKMNLGGNAQIRFIADAGAVAAGLEVKSGNSPADYSAGFMDRGRTFVFTDEGGATLDLAAAATLGNDWSLTIMARGGDVTIDPDSTEQIEGEDTYVVSDGTDAVIRCDGTGFYVQAGGGTSTQPTLQIFTSSGTWNKPAGLTKVRVWVVGGGGASGGGGATANRIGGGGASAGASFKEIDAASLSSSETVTVGAPGTAGSAESDDAGPGGTSSFGTHLEATGGEGGAIGSGAAASAAPGAGLSGDLNFSGETGGLNGRDASNDGNVQPLSLGRGGAAPGPYGGVGQAAPAPNTAGIPGNNYGAGASGGRTGGSGSFAGAAGAPGVVIVEEFY